MTVYVVDCETTSIDSPEVIELAWRKCGDDPRGKSVAQFCNRYKPAGKIALGALAAHNIIEADLIDCTPSAEAKLPPDATYVVGHSVDFDHKALGSPNVRRICTLALARKLWPDLDSHSLAALTYYLMPHQDARELLRNAHSANVDVLLCHMLLVKALDLMPAITTWDRVWAASEKARIPTHFTFGKYGPQKGEPGVAIAEVRRMDPSYIDWCITKCDQCQDEYWQRALRGQV